MTEDAAVKMRVNRTAFEQYYDQALDEHGSTRRIANHVGVSHTLIHRILKERSKTHVNLVTARRFEKFFGAPREVIFLAEVLPSTRNEVRAVA